MRINPLTGHLVPGSTADKGYFATEAALNAAYPSGQAGWHAIIGETDSVKIWDADTNAWVDGGKKTIEDQVFELALICQ